MSEELNESETKILLAMLLVGGAVPINSWAKTYGDTLGSRRDTSLFKKGLAIFGEQRQEVCITEKGRKAIEEMT